MLAQFLTHPPIQLGPIGPELVLVGAAIVVLLGVAFNPRIGHSTLLAVSLIGVAGAAVVSIGLWDWSSDLTVLGGMVATDRFAVVARLFLLGIAAMGLVYGYHYFGRSGEARAEFYPLVLFATAGMTLIAAAADLILVFLALEILSLSLYVLTGISARLSSVEGSMKYFL
ncbi:MAG TPA: hypothetical protein VEN95_07075, partial [Actinomycetota bacterium]|nr:hypothetical protein [Actinomycetota bacterium]